MENVVILGGGIAGLATAIALKRIGITAPVYEATQEWKPVGAGITLAFNALRACERLGILSEVKETGREMNIANIIDSKGQLLTEMDYGNYKSRYGQSNVAIHRHDLHQLLVNQLEPSTLYLGKKVSSFIQDEHSVKLRFEDGEEIETQYVIASDGIHSLFRMQLVPDSHPVYAGYTCWRGISSFPPHYSFGEKVIEAWGSGIRMGVVPVKKGTLYWFAVKTAPEKSEQMRTTTKEDLLRYFQDWTEDLKDVIRTTEPSQILWNDIYDIVPLSQFAFGNILLIGDAAHATTPNMGQGGCQALEDAVVLALCLEKETNMKKTFQLFEQKRLARTRKVQQNSRQLGHMAQWEGSFRTSLRNALAKYMPKDIFVKRSLDWLNNTDF